MPLTASKLFKSFGYCNRRGDDSDSSDDDQYDQIDRAPKGMAWHLGEEEEEQEDQTGGSISGIANLGLSVDDEGVSDSPSSPGGVSDPEGGDSDDERLAAPLTPGGEQGPQGGEITPLGAGFSHGGEVDQPMNDLIGHSDLVELSAGPATPGGPYQPYGCVGVERTFEFPAIHHQQGAQVRHKVL